MAHYQAVLQPKPNNGMHIYYTIIFVGGDVSLGMDSINPTAFRLAECLPNKIRLITLCHQ